MTRFLTTLAALSVAALLFATSTADARPKADKKNKKGSTEITAGGVFSGTIKTVSDDGKTLTVEAPGTKKKPGAASDFKVTSTTKVEYIGIDSKDEQKLMT